MTGVTPKPILVGERIQQLDMLLHIQEFSSMIAVITGAAEMGKTALLETATTQLSIHHQVISFSATNYQTEHQILTLISEQLNTQASWVAIEQTLSAIHAQSESINILIDDAHFLPFELLEMLSVRAVSEDGWHLALAGNTELYDSLIEIQKDLHHTNLVHHIDLTVISEVEALDLVELYFKNEGLVNVPISSQRVTHLWQLAEGIPGKLINLLETEKEKKVMESARFPYGHVAAICLIAIALTFSYLYQGEEAADMDAIDQILASTKPVTGVSLDKENIGTDEISSQLEGSKEETVKDSVVTPNKTPKAISPQATAKVTKALTQHALSESLTKNQKPVVKQMPDEKQANKKVKGLSHPLLNAPANGFGLQLLGVRSKKSAEKVMFEFKQALNSDQLSVYETQYKGQPWFVVVYGPISNQKKARQKAGSIAKALKNKPWVRPMAKIQEDIRKIQP